MMKQTVALIVVILITGAGVWNYSSSQAQQLGPPAPLKIAVVNVAKVLSECKEYLTWQKQSENKKTAIVQQLTQLKQEADAIKAELDANIFKPGSKEHQDQTLKWYQKNYTIEVIQTEQQQAFDMETQAWLEALYQKLLTEVGRIALLEGYTLVLNNDESGIKMPNLNVLQNMIANRKVVYRAAHIDLTDRVLKSLDSNYNQIKSEER